MPTEETRARGPPTERGANGERGRKGRGRRLQQRELNFRAALKMPLSEIPCLLFTYFSVVKRKKNLLRISSLILSDFNTLSYFE